MTKKPILLPILFAALALLVLSPVVHAAGVSVSTNMPPRLMSVHQASTIPPPATRKATGS